MQKSIQRCRERERKNKTFCITQILTRTDEFASSAKTDEKLDFGNFNVFKELKCF